MVDAQTLMYFNIQMYVLANKTTFESSIKSSVSFQKHSAGSNQQLVGPWQSMMVWYHILQ